MKKPDLLPKKCMVWAHLHKTRKGRLCPATEGTQWLPGGVGHDCGIDGSGGFLDTDTGLDLALYAL